MLLKDKVVIVSGIGPGLGQELSTLAAKEGAKAVVLLARTPMKLDMAEEEIRAEGFDTPLLKIRTDITDVEACKAAVAQTIEAFGQIDVLLNSAFTPGNFQPIDQADLNDWRLTMETNFFGAMNMSQAVAPQMKTQKHGAIVMVNTMVTRKPMPYQGGYGASKAALASATSHLALELGAYGIRVNSAFMGWMWGPSVEGYFVGMEKATGVTVAQQRAEVAKNIALGDIPEDGDCAKAVIFLASDYACAITGACLDVNGGEYLAH